MSISVNMLNVHTPVQTYMQSELLNYAHFPFFFSSSLLWRENDKISPRLTPIWIRTWNQTMCTFNIDDLQHYFINNLILWLSTVLFTCAPCARIPSLHSKSNRYRKVLNRDSYTNFHINNYLWKALTWISFIKLSLRLEFGRRPCSINHTKWTMDIDQKYERFTISKWQ